MDRNMRRILWVFVGAFVVLSPGIARAWFGSLQCPLPFACRWIEGQWRNERTGGALEATVIAWRLPRI